MKMEFIGNDDSILIASRRLSRCSADNCVSAADLAGELALDEVSVLAQLDQLMQADWMTRAGDNWTVPATPRTRWKVREHSRLTLGKHYEVLAIEADCYRILNNADDPTLYGQSGFKVVDSVEPAFWKTEIDADGDQFAGPLQWRKSGFWEDYHDGHQAVCDQFWNDLRQFYPTTWKEWRGDTATSRRGEHQSPSKA